MKVLHSVHPEDFKSYQTDTIRERFLIDNLVEPGRINCVYTHYDRMIVGAITPADESLKLQTYPNLRSGYFLERREMAVINVGGAGSVKVNGEEFSLQKQDCLYIGRGNAEVSFTSDDSNNPAIYYMLSCPAHANYPTVLLKSEDAVKVNAGDSSTANKRTICKYVHTEGIKSCQLVMGLTTLHDGSVWNTMPPHVHDRRMEAYFYFDVPEGQRIFHYMGEAQQTRHILVSNYDAVVSPPWSIHSGVGTASYSFIWGMAGENLDYTDMDAIAVGDIL